MKNALNILLKDDNASSTLFNEYKNLEWNTKTFVKGKLNKKISRFLFRYFYACC